MAVPALTPHTGPGRTTQSITSTAPPARHNTTTQQPEVGPMSYDQSTPTGRVRLLTSDTDETAELLTDNDLAALLDLASGNIFIAAALALETIAASEALVGKKIRTQDLATDGPAVAAALLANAARLRAQAPTFDADAGAYFGVVDPVCHPAHVEGAEHHLWGL